jgi:hypothetical protein
MEKIGKRAVSSQFNQLVLTINVPVVYMVRDVNDFDAGKSISRAIGREWTLKIKTLLGPEMATSEASAI